MSYHKYNVGKKFEYNAICDSCGLKFKASELRPRWDGLMVCKDDWEIRHPLDFYRTRNDAHKLPWVRTNSPADPQLTWTSTVANLSITNLDSETGTINNVGNYYADALLGKTRAVITVSFAKPSASDATIQVDSPDPISTTTSTGMTWTMPTVPGSAGSATVVDGRGNFVAKATVAAGNSTVTFGNWTKHRGNLLISALYGT